MRDVFSNFVEPHDLNEERIELELLAKKKELLGGLARFSSWRG